MVCTNDMELVTTDSIISYLQGKVENKEPLHASVWLDAAQKLNILIGDEHDKLFDLQQKVATMKVAYYENVKENEKPNVSKAKMYIETTDEYKAMNKQKAKITAIEEFIRIAKIQARLKDTEYGNQNL